MLRLLPALRSAALLLACLLQVAPAVPRKSVPLVEPPSYAERADAMRFADEVAERRALDPAWVRQALGQARLAPAATKFIMPAASGIAKNWSAYRARFIEPARVQAGAAFWDANAAWLAKAEAETGVPAQIVVGIVGVETLYGQHMGSFRAIDALATLAFDFPTGRSDRSAFFRSELESLFVLCDKSRLDPLALNSSYAGALGMPQFMPSSWLRWAVDFDADGRVDLHASAADVIGSVANYLAAFGWVRGMPTHFDAQPPAELRDRALMLVADVTPTFSAAEFAERGARLAPEGQGFDGKLALLELQNGDAAPSYAAGTQNFYAITRYNQSSYYAMAVIELGRAVARERTPG